MANKNGKYDRLCLWPALGERKRKEEKKKGKSGGDYSY